MRPPSAKTHTGTKTEAWQLEVLMMARKIVILGGGTGGTLLPLKAAKLDRLLESQVVYTQPLPR